MIHAADILIVLDFCIFQAVTRSKNHIGDKCQVLSNKGGMTNTAVIGYLLQISPHMLPTPQVFFWLEPIVAWALVGKNQTSIVFT